MPTVGEFPFMVFILAWLNSQPVISTLLLLMVMDIITGTFAAIIKRTLNSSISWQGMSKKVVMLILVGFASVLETFSQGVPLGKLAAMFYIVTEGLSIVENAGLAGVPLPGAVTDVLVRLSQNAKPPPSRRISDTK